MTLPTDQFGRDHVDALTLVRPIGLNGDDEEGTVLNDAELVRVEVCLGPLFQRLVEFEVVLDRVDGEVAREQHFKSI